MGRDCALNFEETEGVQNTVRITVGKNTEEAQNFPPALFSAKMHQPPQKSMYVPTTRVVQQ